VSELWWLHPEWKDTRCVECGENIWQSGGDPDWGRCYGCFSRKVERERSERQESPSD
jgi:hypothetical protein